jgi:serine/threonine protein kinase
MVARGTRLGAYEILTLIGSGGMGEVYRAIDTKLGRDVAIKILPAIYTAHADRLARFEREARVLASLNHPHIGAISTWRVTAHMRSRSQRGGLCPTCRRPASAWAMFQMIWPTHE